jgi:hypothetical protein
MASTIHFKNKTILIVLGVLLAIFCVVPLFYLTIYQWGEHYVCPYVIAHRVGTDPTYPAIREYIQNILTPGIGRGEVESRLAKIGQVKVWQNSTILFDETTDEIHLILCSDLMDSFTIFTHYSPKGELLRVEIEGD